MLVLAISQQKPRAEWDAIAETTSTTDLTGVNLRSP